MALPGRIIGLLKEYMHDLVEQARQEEIQARTFGLKMPAYGVEEALSDLLAILDDRLESEGVQVGLSAELLHEMWMYCDQAAGSIKETVWLKQNLEDGPHSKARTRSLTYQTLIEYLDREPE
ncbi:MAG: hypothetical protein D6690_09900 [Nitrospirae bacterium]|nr:MAG: hypothetical protein D6690_09900 [Nitrospirota bacterium]